MSKPCCNAGKAEREDAARTVPNITWEGGYRFGARMGTCTLSAEQLLTICNPLFVGADPSNPTVAARLRRQDWIRTTDGKTLYSTDGFTLQVKPS